VQHRLPHDHPHVVRIAAWIQRLDEGTLDANGLQQNLYAIWTALESDLPAGFRIAVKRAQGSLEESVYTHGRRGLSPEGKEALEELRRQIRMAE
jgi:hypothetical protein